MPHCVTYVRPRNTDTVAMVFKNGHIPEQIQKYVLTPAKLYVFDSYSHIIFLDEFDINARSRSIASQVDFRIPKPSG